MVDASSYAPGIPSDVMFRQSGDYGTGAALVVDRAKTPAIDGIRAHTPEPTADTSVTVTSTSTTFVNSNVIDCSDYDRIVILPNKTTGNLAGDALYKLQWSIDQTNWFDGIIILSATLVMTAVPGVTITTAVAAGYQGATVLSYQKLARYCRVSQQSKTAATHTVEYHVSLL